MSRRSGDDAPNKEPRAADPLVIRSLEFMGGMAGAAAWRPVAETAAYVVVAAVLAVRAPLLASVVGLMVLGILHNVTELRYVLARWSGTFAGTFVELSRLLGTKVDDETRDPLAPVFVCVEANTDGTLVWAPNMLRTVQFHPRGFPGYDQLLQLPKEYPQRKLSSIKASAEKVAA